MVPEIVPAAERLRPGGRLPDRTDQVSGAMPPGDYLLLHPEARLSDAEKQQLIQGLQQSLTTSLAK